MRRAKQNLCCQNQGINAGEGLGGLKGSSGGTEPRATVVWTQDTEGGHCREGDVK